MAGCLAEMGQPGWRHGLTSGEAFHGSELTMTWRGVLQDLRRDGSTTRTPDFL